MLPLENHHGRSRQRTSPGEKIDGALLCICWHPYPPTIRASGKDAMHPDLIYIYIKKPTFCQVFIFHGTRCEYGLNEQDPQR